MALECSCPQCGSRYKVDERLAGKKVRCKKCGAGIVVAACDEDDGEIKLDDIAALGESSIQHATAGSIAGRSAAGKSVAGTSAASSSVAGRSRVAPASPPPSVIFEREDDLP